MTVYQYKETQLSIQKFLDNLLEIIKALKAFESRMKEDIFFSVFFAETPNGTLLFFKHFTTFNRIRMLKLFQSTEAVWNLGQPIIEYCENLLKLFGTETKG